MKKTITNLFVVFAMGVLLATMGSAVSEAKTVRTAPDVKKGTTKTIYTVKRKQKGKYTLKKITAKTSKKSVASVKVAKVNGGEKYCVKVTGKKTGSVIVTVKLKKKLPSGKVKTSTLWFSTDVKANKKQKTKTKKPCVLRRGYSTVVYRVKQKEKTKSGTVTVKKVTAKSSNKSVAAVKVFKEKDNRRIYYCVEATGEKWGSAKVTVKVKKKMPSGKIKTSTVRVRVSVPSVPSNKQRAKEAFKLQNKERKKAGQKELKWSDELYDIAVIRVEKDGFDNHRNFYNRWDEHFSIDGVFLDNWGLENLCQGTSKPETAINSWVNSPPHYSAMIRGDLQCGAIAFDNERAVWSSIFTSSSLSSIENWRTETPLLRVRRIDSTTGKEICGSVIRIIDDAGNEVYRTSVKKEKSNNYHIFELDTFIVGRTYTVIETSAPNGYKKASRMTFVARGALEGPIEIVLSSNKR